jgi:hypothetical protein
MGYHHNDETSVYIISHYYVSNISWCKFACFGDAALPRVNVSVKPIEALPKLRNFQVGILKIS